MRSLLHPNHLGCLAAIFLRFRASVLGSRAVVSLKSFRSLQMM